MLDVCQRVSKQNMGHHLTESDVKAGLSPPVRTMASPIPKTPRPEPSKIWRKSGGHSDATPSHPKLKT